MAPRRTILVYTAGAALLHAIIAVVMSSGAFFYLNVGTSQKLFGGSINAQAVFDDVDRHYFAYADEALRGRLPYRDFPVEYPVLAFPLFLLPRMVAGSPSTYRVAFGAAMLLVNAILVHWIGHRVARREGIDRLPHRLAWYTLCVAAFGSLLVARYDLVPALLAFLAATVWASGKNVRGGILAGLGTLVKIFPGAIAGPAFVGELRGVRASWLRGTAAFGSTLALGIGAWLALAGTRVAESFRYHAERGLEAGSLYAGLLMAFAKATGVEYHSSFTHSSSEIVATGASTIGALAMPLQAAALLAVMWRSRHSGLGPDLRYAGAAIMALIVTGKVLSPQYLLWPLPFLAVMEGTTGRRARRVFLACCVATAAVYPWSYAGLIHGKWLAIAILNVRNALLVALLLLLLCGRAVESGESRP